VIRRIPGLSSAGPMELELPDGEYLVRVAHTQYRFDKNKPHYSIQFVVLEPISVQRQTIAGRLYCHAKALWKLSWFLRDFSYDTELLGGDELDEQALVGLIGVLKISHKCINGRMLVNLDAFAPAERWLDFYGPAPKNTEVA
jgi:hypothetical protein